MNIRHALVAIVAALITVAPACASASQQKAEPDHAPVVYAAGDSITWGGSPWARQRVPYPTDLERRCGSDCKVKNVGHPGACLIYKGCNYPTLMRDVLRKEVWPKRPDVVIVAAGANDLGARLPTAHLKAELRAIRHDGAKRGIKVLLATITPGRAFWPEDCEAQRQKLNDWIRTLPHVDFDAALSGRNGELSKRFDSGDGLHPSSRGYKRMAREAWRAMQG